MHIILKQTLLKYLIFFFACLSLSNLSAQIFDSLNSRLQYKPEFYFKIDNRNSFVSSRKAGFSGIKLGFKYQKSLIIGVGFNFLSTDAYLDNYSKREFNLNLVKSYKINFTYLSPFIEYVFYRDNKWEHSIPVQLGFGQASFISNDDTGKEIMYHKKSIILYEPAMTTEYKLFSWFSFGGGIGYRLLMANNRHYGRFLNSPLYMVKINFLFDDFQKGFLIKQ